MPSFQHSTDWSWIFLQECKLQHPFGLFNNRAVSTQNKMSTKFNLSALFLSESFICLSFFGASISACVWFSYEAAQFAFIWGISKTNEFSFKNSTRKVIKTNIFEEILKPNLVFSAWNSKWKSAFGRKQELISFDTFS